MFIILMTLFLFLIIFDLVLKVLVQVIFTFELSLSNLLPMTILYVIHLKCRNVFLYIFSYIYIFIYIYSLFI